MAKSTSVMNDHPMKPRALRGKVVPISIVIATKASTLVAVLVAYYVLAFFAAVQVVPLTMGFVKSGSGVTLDMPLETVLSVWIVPALFLVALVFVLLLVMMRSLWRMRVRVVVSVALWALGEEDGVEARTDKMALLHTKKITRNRSTTSTQTA